MIGCFLFLLGLVLGIGLTELCIKVSVGHGYFKIEERDLEEGLYSVEISLERDQNLLNKEYIILARDDERHESQR